MSNRNDESKLPCPVPDFQRKVFSFSPLIMLLPVGLS